MRVTTKPPDYLPHLFSIKKFSMNKPSNASPKIDPTQQCPLCGSKKIRRSRAKSTDTFIKRLFYNHYRCRECRSRTPVLDNVRVFWSVASMTTLFSFIGLGVLLWFFQDTPRATALKQEKPTKVKELEQLALNGDAEAEFKLGQFYQNGQNHFDNAKNAAKWFKKAAEHGSTEGAYQYGMALLKGNGVLVNYPEALRWMEKSARLGYPRAQFELGNIYRFKIGVDADIKQAYLWYSLAAAQGLAEAASARDSVAASLTHQEIIDLQEQASKLHKSE